LVPALPAVADTIRVQLKHTWGTDADLMVRFYVQYTGSAGTTALYNTFATAIATAWNTDFASNVNNATTLVEVIVEDLTSSSSPSGSWSGSHAGSGGGLETTLATAMLLNASIARRYRGGKPRMYWPAPGGSALVSPSAWQTATITAWNTAISSFMTAVFAAGWSGAGTLSGVNVSYYSGFTVFTGPTGRARNIPKLRTGGPVTDAITGWTANGKPANQRRRLGKR
jgi:hypothetical protein